jgi:hypothetical protein
VQRMKATVEVIYVPGHAGVRYNERADTLAGAAVAFGDLNLTASDICALIADIIKERERGQRTRHCPDICPAERLPAQGGYAAEDECHLPPNTESTARDAWWKRACVPARAITLLRSYKTRQDKEEK